MSDHLGTLCIKGLKEKYFIINDPPPPPPPLPEEILLNKGSELTSKCRHENKNMLANVGNSDKRNNNSID